MPRQMLTRRDLLLLGAAIGGSRVRTLSAQPSAPRAFVARLSTVPMDLTMASTVAGSGSVTATLNGRTLVLAGAFSGLKTSATAARLHRGPTRGVRGDAIFDLTATAGTSGELTGTVELSAAQVEDLEKGRLYVQLHSEKAPEGNLWGWLLPKK
jgi:hypothetical protein